MHWPLASRRFHGHDIPRYLTTLMTAASFRHDWRPHAPCQFQVVQYQQIINDFGFGIHFFISLAALHSISVVRQYRAAFAFRIEPFWACSWEYLLSEFRHSMPLTTRQLISILVDRRVLTLLLHSQHLNAAQLFSLLRDIDDYSMPLLACYDNITIGVRSHWWISNASISISRREIVLKSIQAIGHFSYYFASYHCSHWRHCISLSATDNKILKQKQLIFFSAVTIARLSPHRTTKYHNFCFLATSFDQYFARLS
jgi:hypothetical protein